VNLPLYFDVHVHGAVADQLRVRGIDVLTAQEDNHDEAEDPFVLNRATALGRPVVTFDDDFLREAQRRQRDGIEFSGVIYGHLLNVRVGQLVSDLQLVAETMDADELQNQVLYLPL
jgi:predicted nuclease of predicted toxin-antitoxin system